MHTHWYVLIEISMEIGMINFWSVIIGHCSDERKLLYCYTESFQIGEKKTEIFHF
jgi:hypothetical protein